MLTKIIHKGYSVGSGKKSKQPQIPDLLRKVKACVQFDRWSLSIHASERKEERDIDVQDMMYVLKNGFHEEKKTTYDERYNSWKYAIRGTTVDGNDLRIIITFVTDDLLVITVIRVRIIKK